MQRGPHGVGVVRPCGFLIGHPGNLSCFGGAELPRLLGLTWAIVPTSVQPLISAFLQHSKLGLGSWQGARKWESSLASEVEEDGE